MNKKELEEIKQRAEVVQNIPWMKLYASDETQKVIFEDLPKLISEIERMSKPDASDDIKKIRIRPHKA